MRRGFVLGIFLALAATSAVSAQTMTYVYEDKPAFSLTYPAGWEIRMPREEGRNVISAFPTDGSLLWQGMWIMRETSSVDEALDRLKAMEKGLFESVKLSKEPWTEKIGELEARCYKGTGMYQESQPVESFMALFELPGGRIGALGYVGDPQAIETHRAELTALMQSLEAAK